MNDKNNISNTQPKKKQKVVMREKRNKQYEEMAKEYSSLNISEIRVEDFVEARKKELNKFVHILNNKYNSKTGFQLLPKHMRRRQMSHNPFRIPVRSRIANLNINVKSKCYKHKKKRAFLKTSIIRRARKNNWLETHIWHSKRFTMKKLFGYSIASKRMDKGFKACYRYSKYDSCVYDSSYFNYLTIPTDNNTTEVFQQIVNLITIETLTNFNLFQSYRFNIYDPQTGRLIGPVNFLLFHSYILVQFHPLMKEEIANLFNQSQFPEKIYFSNLFNNFRLIGPHIGSILFKIIKSLTFENDNHFLQHFENENEFEKDLHYLQEGKIIVFRQMMPKSNFRMNEFTLNKITNIILKENKSDEIIEINFLDMINNLNEINSTKAMEILKEKSKLLSEFEENEDVYKDIEIPTERTVYQHRRKVVLEKLNKKISLTIKNKYKSKDIHIQSKKQENKEMMIDETIPKNDLINLNTVENVKQFINREEETYFIIVKENFKIKENNQIKIIPIYNLIFPNGYSVDLLRRFVYLTSRPIGLSEYNYYLTCSNQFIFPDDYPSTESYNKYTQEQTISKIDKYCLFPASKRINYQKIKNPYPFYAAWNRLKHTQNPNEEIKFLEFNKNVEIVCDLMNKIKIISQFKIQKIIDPNSKIFLIPIALEMTGKGIPENNSLICLPTHNDLLKFKEKEDYKISKSNFIDKVLNSKDNLQKFVKIKENDKSYIMETKSKIKFPNKLFNLEYKTIKGLGDLNYSSDVLEKDFTLKLYNEKLSRKIIGFVTTGEFSYDKSKGMAKGFILIDFYQTLVKLKNDNNFRDVTVLIRNKNSRIYYPAKINILDI